MNPKAGKNYTCIIIQIKKNIYFVGKQGIATAHATWAA